MQRREGGPPRRGWRDIETAGSIAIESLVFGAGEPLLDDSAEAFPMLRPGLDLAAERQRREVCRCRRGDRGERLLSGCPAGVGCPPRERGVGGCCRQSDREGRPTASLAQ